MLEHNVGKEIWNSESNKSLKYRRIFSQAPLTSDIVLHQVYDIKKENDIYKHD